MANTLRIFKNLLCCWRKDLGVQPGWIELGLLYMISNKGNQKLCKHIPPSFRPSGQAPLIRLGLGKKPIHLDLEMWLTKLVTIAGLADLHQATCKAEEIEMARNLTLEAKQYRRVRISIEAGGIN